MTGITTELTGAKNVLLEEPPIGQGRDVCTSLLLGEASEPNVLFVSFTRQAAACVDQVTAEQVGDVGVITVGDASGAVEDDSVRTESVSTPSDLTGLGIKIGQFLSTWEPPIHICFESLTSMLQYVDYQTAYQFLHSVTGQIHAADATAHFHIDPDAHEDKVVAGITSLFDGRVTIGDDESEVQTRKLLAGQ